MKPDAYKTCDSQTFLSCLPLEAKKTIILRLFIFPNESD